MIRKTWLVAAVATLTVAGMTWVAVPQPALGQGRAWSTQLTLSDLRSISCPTTSDCWAVGSNSTAPVVYHTVNGGQSWVIQTVADPIGFLQSVYCQSNGLDCWAAGVAEAGTGAAGVIYSTTDGGLDWTGALVTSTTDATRLNAIACPGSGPSVTCIAVGNTGSGFGTSTGSILLVAGDLSSVQTVPVPAQVATLTGLACQGAGDCLATGVSTAQQSTGVFTGTLVSTTDAGQHWSTVSIPADISGLAAVACPASGNCAAAGYSAPSGGSPQGVVINGSATASAWPGEAHISGVDYLDGIACPAAKTCLAAGYTGSGTAATAELAWTTDGTSWSTQSAGAGYLDAVACPQAGTCWTSGYQALGSSGSGDIDSLVMGGTSWTVQSQVALGPRIGLSGVSCADQTHCVAVGNSASGPVILATSDGTTWSNQTPPSPPPGVVYHLDAVACPSALDCVAVGYELSAGSGSLTKTAISTSTSNGATWSHVTILTGVSYFDAITCPSQARCLAAGTQITNLASGAFTGVIDTTTNLGSTWSTVTIPATVGYLTGVSCAPSSSTCAAVGGTPSGPPTVITTTTGTTWSTQTLPSLPGGGTFSDLYAVSCPTTTTCAAVGDQLLLAGGMAQGQAVILSGSGSGLTSWTVQIAPSDTGSLKSVTCSTATTCEAVGTTISPDITPGDGPTTTAVSTNDGLTWVTDTLPTNVPLLRAVACAPGASTCRAVGTSVIIGVGS